MSVISVNLLASNAPVNGLAQVPTITIQREDGTEDVADAAMTDRGTRGKYTFNFADVIDRRYSFLIDADPTSTGQVDVRYHNGAFDGDGFQIRELLESDQVFDEAGNLLHYYRKGTTADLITPKTEVGAIAPNDVSLTQ